MSPSKFGDRDIGEYLSFEPSAQDVEIEAESKPILQRFFKLKKKE